MTDYTTTDMRRDAIERAARFLEQRGYNAAIQASPKPAPTVAELLATANSILSWMIQPLPGGDLVDQQPINAQAEGQFRDLLPIMRHATPDGWHTGSYADCPTCGARLQGMTGGPSTAIPGGSTGIAQGPGPTNRYAPTKITTNEMIDVGCSPLAKSQHTEATKRAVSAIDSEIASTQERYAAQSAAQPTVLDTPGTSPSSPLGSTNLQDLQPSISTYKRPY